MVGIGETTRPYVSSQYAGMIEQRKFMEANDLCSRVTKILEEHDLRKKMVVNILVRSRNQEDEFFIGITPFVGYNNLLPQIQAVLQEYSISVELKRTAELFSRKYLEIKVKNNTQSQR